MRIIGLAKTIQARLKDASSFTKLVPLSANLVDKTHAFPPRSDSQLYDYPLSIVGKPTSVKLEELRSTLSKRVKGGQEWIYLLPALPSIAWLFNYRCEGDVEGVPIAYAYAAITRDQCILFIDSKKLRDDEVLRKRWAKQDGVTIKPYGVNEIGMFVKKVASASAPMAGQPATNAEKKLKVWAPRECSWALQEECKDIESGVEIDIIQCPIEEAKAIKNEAEIQGMRNAYLRDGRATVRSRPFLTQYDFPQPG